MSKESMNGILFDCYEVAAAGMSGKPTMKSIV